MSSAAFALDTDTAASSRSRAQTSGLRVSKPGDALEAEADRVAERVMNGTRLPEWSLAASGFGTIQRQPVTGAAEPPAPKAAHGADILGTLAQAFLETATGRRIVQMLKDDPAVKATQDFVSTPGGIVVTGAAALGAVTALAAAHKPLPVGIPDIPLDRVHPGLSLHVSVEGPLNHPTSAMLTLSFHGKASAKHGGSTAAAHAPTSPAAHPGGAAQKPDALSDAVNAWTMRRLMAIGRPDKGGAPQTGHAAQPGSGAATATPALRLPAFESPLKPKPPTLLDKTLELKPIAAPSGAQALTHATDAETKKREDLPVQRKAERAVETEADFSQVVLALNSPSRPLDRETRRFMESRIGFDFARVRVHTDARAAASAKTLGAKAYTVGDDVVFAQGRYAPASTEGRRLLAHELAHVVQQSGPQRRHQRLMHAAPRQVQRSWDISLPSLKEWVASKVRTQPVYPLICFVLGKDPISGAPFNRTAQSLVEAILKLVPQGQQVLDRLKEVVAAFQRAYDWLTAEFEQLKLNEDYFLDVFKRAKDAFLSGSFGDAEQILREPFDKLVLLASRAIHKAMECVVEAALETIGASGIIEVFRKGRDTIKLILADPGAFIGHLIDAVKAGVGQFGKNILDHLKEGLVQWLFGEIKITLPKTLNPAGIVSMILSVLGLTYSKFKQRLIEALGEPAVQFLETTFEVVKAIYVNGLGAAADLILSKAKDLADSVMNAVRDWVVTKLVVAGVEKVAGMFTPLTGLINVITIVYKVVDFFIEKAKALQALVTSVVDSVSEVANGNIEKAANAIEQAMATSIPLVLRFLAGVLGLGNVSEQVRKTIKSIEEKVTGAVNKVFDFIIEKGRALWEQGKGAFTYVVDWWKKPVPVTVGGEAHELTVEGDAGHHEIMVHSDKSPLRLFLKDVNASKQETDAILALAQQVNWRQGPRDKLNPTEVKAQEALAELAKRLGNLKSVNAAPKAPKPDYSGTHRFGGGLKVAAYLSADHEVGSEPDRSHDPPIWTDLGTELLERKSYVRGHLLSMRLGGQGVWKNMMPITNSTNQAMERRVERDLKKAIGTGKRYLRYTVQAQYADTPVKPKSPESAEARLVKLSWTVKPAKYEDGKFKVDSGPLLDEKGKQMDIDASNSLDPTAASQSA
ncbi:eCIS core domain-containing protein [Paraburkholderia acidiphila]|uniref:DUF4157 domain-containing protein n=1 Tax=Paraburkholderia acidiphila TaxID=2571747 RepID=A0A7Z2GCZ6_9BURK|nr:DUF4157 domain-containing protein [Paraburkholderia acidiphila]QGZ59463.1 DUF4157 domain-containing protein [Paraburkholderia acidiphila]